MKIKETRERLKLTQRELATVLCLGKHGYRTIQRWESGDRNISPCVIKLLKYIEKYGDIENANKKR